jgi:4-alpha-glucanotransferase
MNLHFNVDYRTRFGEEVVLNVVNGSETTKYRMMTANGVRWSYNLNMPSVHPDVIDYFYDIERDGRSERREWTTITHRLELDDARGGRYTIYDRWHDIPEDSYLYSSAFTDCLFARKHKKLAPTPFTHTVRLVVRAPQLRARHRLAIVGEGKEFGDWDASKSLPMTEHSYNEWIINLDANMFPDGMMEFKFVAVSDDDREDVIWESGYNRTIKLPVLDSGEVVVYDLNQAFFPIYDARVAGTLVPVFSLRSKHSFGVGDFGDVKRFIDYIALTGQHVLQVLPINDTTSTHTWTDSYPYSCISIFALHPQYADLSALPELKDAKLREQFEKERRELNALPKIDYERVNNAKLAYLKALYEQEGAKTLGTHAYREFFKENERWLVPYAQFCTLRDEYGTADFSQWPDHRVWDEADRKELANSRSKDFKRVAFWYFVQFILDEQMADAHQYARQHHVILKGDIPIGVSRHGCDVWMEPRYFNLNGQAGAPPDAFSVNGQNWGFPTYNWDEMLKDGCHWWIRRFRNMAKYFDAYRIDHVLGFFRIWEIPIESVHGLLGQFSPSLAMTADEIRSYGFNFQEERYTTPFITDWVLDRVFHDDAAKVKEQYLEPIDSERYRMKPAYDTQRKIADAFKGVTDELQLNLRDGLMALVSDVLFVRDRKDASKFHPRITAQLDFVYESLYDIDKTAFNNLYNDYYYRRNNQFWYGEAMKKLPVLVQATRMLVCAEDLGMVPDCVPWVMNQLRILSLEIQSMPKDPTVRFGHLSRNPYRSVCTFSTHDMPTLRQWWDEDYARTQEYYNTMLYRQGPAPHPLPGWLARDILSRQLMSPSMLCILSIQDWMAMDENLRLKDADAERINVPAIPQYYWRYRMHVNIEDLIEDKSFTQNIKDLVQESGR